MCGSIFLLNGASSASQSTLAGALLRLLPSPLRHDRIDPLAAAGVLPQGRLDNGAFSGTAADLLRRACDPRHLRRHPHTQPEGGTMSTERPSAAAPIGLVVGALLGLAGSFAPSAAWRGLAWGLDGTALVVAAAVLAVHCLRHDQPSLAAGFLVFIAGQTLVLSGSAMSLEASSPLFAAGSALWSAALLLVSVPDVMPRPVRVLGGVAAVLFAATALQVFAGRSLTPLSEPLPFFAYPVFVLTLFGWAWWCRRPTPGG